jgi:hypothetical protein
LTTTWFSRERGQQPNEKGSRYESRTGRFRLGSLSANEKWLGHCRGPHSDPVLSVSRPTRIIHVPVRHAAGGFMECMIQAAFDHAILRTSSAHSHQYS